MSFLTTIGTATACCGVLFFLFCAGLVFWYLFNQPKQVASAAAPDPLVQGSVEHPSAGTPEPSPEPSPWSPEAAQVSDASTSSDTPGVDG
jgi:hypothetical protein